MCGAGAAHGRGTQLCGEGGQYLRELVRAALLVAMAIRRTPCTGRTGAGAGAGATKASAEAAMQARAARCGTNDNIPGSPAVPAAAHKARTAGRCVWTRHAVCRRPFS